MHPDCIVVGGGVVGLATAVELAACGASVRVLERGALARESTWAGAGILSPLPPWQYGPALNALSEYSRGLFADWCARLAALSGVDPQYRRDGMLVLPDFDQDAALAWCARSGWRASLCRAGDALADAGDLPALWLPDVAQARNPRLARALIGAARALGVELCAPIEVLGVDVAARRVRRLVTGSGGMSAQTYVVAAGAWSGRLPGLEVLRNRIEPVRGQMLLYHLPPGTLRCIVYRDGRYLVPRADGHILAGSTLERVGFDPSTTPEACASLHAFAAGLLPELAPLQPLRHWSGLRPGSPDNVPSIGRHPEVENLYVNTGHFRYGLTLAPGSARILVSRICSEPAPIAHAPYDLASTPCLNLA